MIDYVLLQLNNVKKVCEQMMSRLRDEGAQDLDYSLKLCEYQTRAIFAEAENRLEELRKPIEEGLIGENLDSHELERFVSYMRQLKNAGVAYVDISQTLQNIYYSSLPPNRLEGYITAQEYRKKYGLSERHLKVNQMFHRVIPIVEIGEIIFVLDRPLTEGERLNLNSETYLTLGEVATHFRCDQSVAKLLAQACQANPAEPTWAQKYAKTTWYHGPDLERMKLWLESAERVDKKGHSLIRFEGLVWCEKCSKTWKTAPRNECDF